MARVHGGEIGPVVAIETTYNSQGVWEPDSDDHLPRAQCKSDMEYQMRNWYYYSWLSGDHIVEQAVHGLDTMAWAMNDAPPLRAGESEAGRSGPSRSTATSTTISRSSTNIPDDVRGYHQCRHWANTRARTADFVQGTKGRADGLRQDATRSTGSEQVALSGRPTVLRPLDMYQSEHNEMFAALRAGKPINNAETGRRQYLAGPDGSDGRLHGRSHHLGDRR